MRHAADRQRRAPRAPRLVPRLGATTIRPTPASSRATTAIDSPSDAPACTSRERPRGRRRHGDGGQRGHDRHGRQLSLDRCRPILAEGAEHRGDGDDGRHGERRVDGTPAFRAPSPTALRPGPPRAHCAHERGAVVSVFPASTTALARWAATRSFRTVRCRTTMREEHHERTIAPPLGRGPSRGWRSLAMGGTGLAGHVADKTGSDTVVLHLATIDGDVNPNGQVVRPAGLRRQSRRRLRRPTPGGRDDVLRRRRQADAESRLVEADRVRRHRRRLAVDAGLRRRRHRWSPGDRSPDDDHQLRRREGTRHVADRRHRPRAARRAPGVVGLGLGRRSVAPTVRRRGATARAGGLGGRTDSGSSTRRSRRMPSPRSAGSRRISGPTGSTRLNAGTLRGAEFDIAQYSANGLTTEAGFVTANVVLWPKVFVLSMSQQRFDALTDEQREWVTAGRRARDAGLRRRQLRRDDARPRALRRGSPLRLRRRRGDRRTARWRWHPSSTSWPPIRTTVRCSPTCARSPTDIPTRTCPTCRPAASRPNRRRPMPPRSRTKYRRYRTAPTGWRSRPAMPSRPGCRTRSGWVGTWTLEVKDGTYAVTCRALDDAQQNCGGSNGYEGALEAGDLRGTGSIAVLRLQPRALGAADRLPAAGVDRRRSLLAEPVVLDDLGARRRLPHVRRPTSTRPPDGSSSRGSGSAERGSSRDRRRHGRAGSGWTRHPEPAAARGEAVGQPEQARAEGVGSSAAVVGDGELGTRARRRRC